jgi:hypothetical protein
MLAAVFPGLSVAFGKMANLSLTFAVLPCHM